MNEFYRFRCEGDTPTSAELLIFAAIGDWEDMGEIGARQFAASLGALPKSVKRIDLHINSPGGSLFEASAIYSRLADHPSQKFVYIDGLAASAASIVAMVGHRIHMRSNSTMMIHLPQGIAMGNSDDMRKMAGALDTVTESMLNVYAKRTNLPRDEIRELLAAETWLSPDQAVEKGFADEVRGVVKAAASLGEHRYIFNGVTFDLSRFQNVPSFAAAKKDDDDDDDDDKNGDREGDDDDDKKNKGKKKMKNKPTDTTADPTAPPAPPTPAPAPPKPPGDPPDTQAELAASYQRGITEERERIAALQKLDRPATHAIIAKAIADGKSVADITAELFEAMDKAGRQDARRRDASALNGIPGSTTDVPDSGEDDYKRLGGMIKERVQARLKQRRLVHGKN